MTSIRKTILGSASAAMMMIGFGGMTPATAAISHNHTDGSGHSIVEFTENVEPGTVVVSASQRRLYYALGDGTAISYRVAVPKRGKEWSGETSIASMRTNPDWTPPADVRADHPELPEVIPGGAPNNPMGTRAMVLDSGEVAIHGTTQKMRASIGSAASYGCIRMLNEDVADLYGRVHVGTRVIMEP
jgi:lipoprotein-anchoring transpeptidase ErfK/SrfK